jgi:GNAT superfamily N-acetyltransferase
MKITARQASVDDLPALTDLYRKLQKEMAGYSDMWKVADGLAEPIEPQLEAAISDPETLVYLGEIDGVALGFALARIESMLPQADGRRIGSFRLVFVDHDAREVGLGEALRDTAMEELAGRGITRFDAHVLPGHRLVKNFFESGGFSARSIVMHHDAERDR